MESLLLSNPIYQHSGETEKVKAVAEQASVNEDQEQRRRLLDSQGERIKESVAKEVARNIHLKQTPFEIKSEPILQQAQHAVGNVLHNALEAGKSLLHSASAATGLAAEKATHLGHDAADYVSHATKDAAGFVTHAAQEAAHQASDLSKKVVDTTTSAAGVLQQKTKEIADVAANKAFEVADNINHFTTLVSVLAEEENERARRLVSGDEARAAANAFRISELIRDLGIAFYKQSPNLNYTTKVLEEAERRWRLNSSHTSLAETNAHNVGKLVSRNLQSFMPRYQWARANIGSLEEKERTRRMNDSNEVYSIINALNLADVIRDLGLGFYRQEGTFSRTHAGYATTLLEENERRNRIRQDKLIHAEDSAHLLMDVVANNMEKFNYSTRHAAHFATEFANLLGSATKKAAVSFSQLTQDLAKNAATRVRSVAHDLATYSTAMYVIALEERERARRLSDSDEITAINNAWIQSGLIRELDSLYRPTHRAVFPARLLEEQERRWRMATLKPASSRRLAELVNANHLKFELAAAKLGKLEHARETASHSKLNPRAPEFVPHVGLSKPEAPIQRNLTASGAQL